MNNIIISNDDEIFLKSVLKDFHCKIIEMNNINDFEEISSEWIKHKLENDENKNPEKFLKMMKQHKESKFWFTSFMGFFYQLGIGCELDRMKALEFYLSTIDDNEIEKDSLNKNFNQLYLIDKNEDTFNLLRNKNIIIGKYLLSLFYYKDIIIDIEGFNYNQNKKEAGNNQNELMKLVKLAKNGDSEAQYNLAVCYMDGIGIQKNEQKAFEWFLKSEQSEYVITQNKNEKEEFERHLKLAIANNLVAQNYVGYCYDNGLGTGKNETKTFEWYLKSAENGYAMAQNNLGISFQYGKGTNKNETKAFEWYTKSAIAGCANGQCNLG